MVVHNLSHSPSERSRWFWNKKLKSVTLREEFKKKKKKKKKNRVTPFIINLLDEDVSFRHILSTAHIRGLITVLLTNILSSRNQIRFV